ncbi:putative molybdenum cofactor guanylyltransferase protein [Marine Group I thaumarchaeote SCGC AAA799-E16]|uniref:Putative molybdenum cofactor guanylyltransferase protein n=3 Tax=Marine Group I TaxID=905826 RepID=A0A087RMV2_9ARCH|nr:putative molybdenum cofactor guanylyltransferase protein [Marine Group I thaumarchaeote SCGC AAA799-E16]KFM14806.1 putative molybdenum cofactor guanylyltransferase protein [Marine Group I thaumarchaeote SCGC AAA799-D11]KFM17561.1 putative molybdenum cofactor guanylyltransferase protein [Marine Group I thaumarchaeote SCGC RSA3]
MIGIVMAGGKGTRMNLDNEKLLLHYKKPIILHVVDSLKNSNCFSKVIAVTSPNSPKTKKLLEENNIETFDTSGLGYVEDLNLVLQKFNDLVFVTSGDMPLLDEKIIQTIVNQHDSNKIWTSILVTEKLLTSIGTNSEYSIIHNNQKCHFTGISLIDSQKINSLENLEENFVILDDKRIALNLNTKQDYDLLSTA